MQTFDQIDKLLKTFALFKTISLFLWTISIILNNQLSILYREVDSNFELQNTFSDLVKYANYEKF